MEDNNKYLQIISILDSLTLYLMVCPPPEDRADITVLERVMAGLLSATEVHAADLAQLQKAADTAKDKAAQAPEGSKEGLSAGLRYLVMQTLCLLHSARAEEDADKAIILFTAARVSLHTLHEAVGPAIRNIIVKYAELQQRG